MRYYTFSGRIFFLGLLLVLAGTTILLQLGFIFTQKADYSAQWHFVVAQQALEKAEHAPRHTAARQHHLRMTEEHLRRALSYKPLDPVLWHFANAFYQQYAPPAQAREVAVLSSTLPIPPR